MKTETEYKDAKAKNDPKAANATNAHIWKMSDAKKKVVPITLSFSAALLAFSSLLLTIFQAVAEKTNMPAIKVIADLVMSASIFVVAINIGVNALTPNEKS